MKLSRLVPLFVLVLAIAQITSASSFSTVFSAVDNEILLNETARFDVTISNFDMVQHRFQIYSIDPNWIVKVDPPMQAVPPESSLTFPLTIRPKNDVPYGSQGLVVNVKDLESGDTVRRETIIAIKKAGDETGVYVPSVAFGIEMKERSDPREPMLVTVYLRNRNNLNIEGMSLALSSPHLEKSVTIDLPGLTDKTLTYQFPLPVREPPQEHVMRGLLTYHDEKVSEAEVAYSIAAYTNVLERHGSATRFFKTTRTVTLSNDGNVENAATTAFKTSWFAKLFSSPTPEAVWGYSEGERAFVWSVTLEADETKTLTLATNYRPLFFIALLIIFILLLYFVLRSPVVSLKEVVSVKHAEGLSDVKVRIFIKNRSNKIIQAVDVTDKIPSIAEVSQTNVLGTIKPSKIQPTGTGTILKWNLDVLEPYEERILTYTLKSKLKIIGHLRLPRAQVKFESRPGQERITYTNNVQFVEKL